MQMLSALIAECVRMQGIKTKPMPQNLIALCQASV